MARQGGHVQLDQSDMLLALNVAKMAKVRFSHAAHHEMHQLIKTGRVEFEEEKQRGVVFPGHQQLKVAIDRHSATIRENQTDGSIPCQNGTAKNPQ
jgi:hypothetical protein